MSKLVPISPELAAEWHPTKNNVDIATISAGSHSSRWWIGPCGHEFSALVKHRSKGSGCPYCAGKAILPGFNDLTTVRPDLAQDWDHSRNHIAANSVGLSSKIPVAWKCSVGHEWVSSVSVRSRKLMNECPVCQGRKTVNLLPEPVVKVVPNNLAITNPELLSSWDSSLNQELSYERLTPGSEIKAWWNCEIGHSYQMPIAKRTNGRGCPFCSGKSVLPGFNDLVTKDPALAQEWHPTLNGDLKPQEISAGSHAKFWWQCSRGHSWQASIDNRGRNKRGCPYCAGKAVLVGFNDLATTEPVLAAEWHPTLNLALSPQSVSRGSDQKVWWQCDEGHEWQMWVYARSGGHGCPECWAKSYISKPERELYVFLTSLGFEVIQSDRKVLGKNQEIDLYLPEKQFGIEFNGLYWHNEYWKDSQYHLQKFEAAKAAGVQLVQIWEDDWNKRKNTVLRALAHKLGVSKQLAGLYPELSVETETVYARKTSVTKISTEQARIFLETNHIQGFASGSYYLALTDENSRIRAVMVLKKEANNTLNIVRYATAGSVTGGFTKLLKHAAKTDLPSSFITFADHTISDGGLYENNGFTADKELPPDYMYVARAERKHKFGYRLKRFKNDDSLVWQEGLTERELALLNSLPRIWDAGKTRYRLNCQN